jgi:hypothetical protein
MLRLGVLVKDLSVSELNWKLLASAQRLSLENRASITFFCEDRPAPCRVPAAPCVAAIDAWAYDGPVVATSLETARKLLGLPGPRKRLYYLWDLAWLRPPTLHHADYRRVHTGLPLAARTADMAAAVTRAWGVPCAVAPDADLEALLALCS